MHLFSEDIEFLKELYKYGKINMYLFHEKYMLSPAQLARVIRKFEKIYVINLEGNSIILSEYGRKWIFLKRKEIFIKERFKYWKEVPKEMQQERLRPNELYLPIRKNLDVF